MFAPSPSEIQYQTKAYHHHQFEMNKIVSNSPQDHEMPKSPHHQDPPMSRTYQYRKVMKPLLERKRRARINKCLDELKDIIIHSMQSDGESITKLEKADVLELTVRHLRKLKKQNALGLTPEATYASKFKSGYIHCAQEVSQFMSGSSAAPIDVHVSTRLISHLSSCVQALESMTPNNFNTSTTSQSSTKVRSSSAAADRKPMSKTSSPLSETSKKSCDKAAWRPW